MASLKILIIMKNRKIQAVVIGDSYAEADKYEFAREIGRFLAGMKIVVITGGRGGVMEAVSKGVFEKGGITIGILPSHNLDDANDWCTVSIPTGMGHARNALTALAGDFIISIGGGAGTMTEIGFGRIYHKPVIAVMKFGGWSEKFGRADVDFQHQDEITAVNNMAELKSAVKNILSQLSK
jgi:uncharacterized protein (TIGR00725 family)